MSNFFSFSQIANETHETHNCWLWLRVAVCCVWCLGSCSRCFGEEKWEMKDEKRLASWTTTRERKKMLTNQQAKRARNCGHEKLENSMNRAHRASYSCSSLLSHSLEPSAQIWSDFGRRHIKTGRRWRTTESWERRGTAAQRHAKTTDDHLRIFF